MVLVCSHISSLDPFMSYATVTGGPYRTSRIARTIFRWMLTYKNFLELTKSGVKNLKVIVTGITFFGGFSLIPRIISTFKKLVKEGKDFVDNIIYLVGDVSKLAMLVFYKIALIRLVVNVANLYVYGKRLIKVFNYEKELATGKDRIYLGLELNRTIICVAYSALHLMGIYFGQALLADVTFLAITSVKQLLHIGMHYHKESAGLSISAVSS